MGNMYIWGSIGIGIVGFLVLAYFIYRHMWGKAEDLGAAEEKVESAAGAREIERKMAQAQANRKTAKEYVDWVREQGRERNEGK